ncbi:MAM and LDL-receptor class A domain-containing protein 1-like [Saccostrea echinata]|uniref:MAM and LDL-receptor class A domain-containing protein 1-like n=1 Tax=Saccostrea echinata TaxID=191078 RepID=UPI002A83C3D4|nr:MAM and LDL-receptor class A domain-containing protein 1-like [Saccostrea echinata]
MKGVCFILTFSYVVISVIGYKDRNWSSDTEGCEKLNVTRVRFMIAVNATYQGEHGCIASVQTPWLPPGKKLNETKPIKVGYCDKGQAIYQIIPATDGKSKVSINVTFFSSDVLDADPPMCQIPFNGTFLLPGPDGYDDELMPNCYVEDSREGDRGLTCNFDNGPCEWYSVKGNSVQWKIGTGSTQDPSSGPDGDHSPTGNGQYLYIDGHEFFNSSLVAEIRSPDFYILDNSTLSFWYHMNGAGVGELRVIFVDRYNYRNIVWSKSGRQGSGWHQAILILNDLTAYVIFEGSTRLHYSSDIAIDDVSVSKEPYEITLDCTFNKDTCSWLQDSGDNLDFHRWYGRSPDFTSGPKIDHKNTTEFYLLLKGHEARNSSWTARMYSPYVNIDSPRNLTFWYHMNGANIGHLKLYREFADGTKQQLFIKSGRQSSVWEQAHITLPTGFYKLVFEADAAHHYSSDLAIDDIRLHGGVPIVG